MEKIEKLHVINWICLAFAITFSLLFNYFTETIYGMIGYLPYIVSQTYVMGYINGKYEDVNKKFKERFKEIEKERERK